MSIHEIIMPALGMSQDTGVIVAWHKAAGDPVRADDVLMEVETDKATMEVEAGHDGYVHELRAAVGADVAIGHVVAIISDEATPAGSPEAPETGVPVSGDTDEVNREQPASDAGGSATESLAGNTTAQAAAASPPTEGSSQSVADTGAKAAASVPTDWQPTSGGVQVLASPKARFEAHRRGINLADLVSAGVAQPLHLADLDRLPAIAPHAASAERLCHLQGSCDATRFREFIVWLTDESGEAIHPVQVWCSFAAGALRSATDCPTSEDLTLSAGSALTAYQTGPLVNPDLHGLTALSTAGNRPDPASARIDLSVEDLTGTGVEALPDLPGTAAGPCLYIMDADDGHYRLSVGFPPSRLSLHQAAALLQGVVARIREPLEHLL